ncbi:hypothetical protein [Paenibacillus hamazuiensis]|uniref:hypothetical protein n=1 Tax=Paenibacillus hamazuiensis TaxID=2936508 RepID=UPI00200C2A35|nr:hypothetical protein [Paenibacillus hamazuiensis]
MKKMIVISLCAFCTLLAVFGLWMADSPASAEVSQETSGIFAGTDAKQKTMNVRVQGADQSYPLASSVWVYRNGKKAALSDLQPGDTLDIILNSKGQAAYIKAASAAPSPAPAAGTGGAGTTAAPGEAASGTARSAGSPNAGAAGQGSGASSGIAAPGSTGLSGSSGTGASGSARSGVVSQGSGAAAATQPGSAAAGTGAGQKGQASSAASVGTGQAQPVWSELKLSLRGSGIRLEAKLEGKQGESKGWLYIDSGDHARIKLDGNEAQQVLRQWLAGVNLSAADAEEQVKQRLAKELGLSDRSLNLKLEVKGFQMSPPSAASSTSIRDAEDERPGGKLADSEKDDKNEKTKEKRDEHPGKGKDKGKDKDKDD